MKLLYDHNLSPRLVERLADIFPDAQHVAGAGLSRATDDEVWTYAASQNACIVTKDSDFNDLSVLREFPPKVMWLRIGNCTTAQLESLLRSHAVLIHEFLLDDTARMLMIRPAEMSH